MRVFSTFFTAVILVAASFSCVAYCEELQSSGHNPVGILREFKLVSGGSGWVSTGSPENGGESDCLYWTDDNGQTWRDITPHGMLARSRGLIFFLNRWHGWVLSTDDDEHLESAHFYVLSTIDGARHWQSLMLQKPKLTDNGNDNFLPTQIYFSDPQNGWILWRYDFTHSSRYALLETNDGGHTWKPLPEPPGAGPALFVTSTDGWIIGRMGDDDVGVPGNTQLWRTNDGGRKWRPVAIPFPKNSAEQGLFLIALKFLNTREGMVAAGLQDVQGGASVGFFNCRTEDGGKTWRISQFRALRAAIPSIGAKHIFWSVDRDIQMDSEPMPLILPVGRAPGGDFLELDFLDDLNAWIEYREGLEPRFTLIATIDGGKTSRFIWPPSEVTKGSLKEKGDSRASSGNLETANRPIE